MAELHWEVVAVLLGSDPISGEEALNTIVSTGIEGFRTLVPVSGNPPHATTQGERRLAKLYAKLGGPALAHVLDVLEGGDWPNMLRAAKVLDGHVFVFADRGVGRVADLLEHEQVDTVRCALLALGHM